MKNEAMKMLNQSIQTLNTLGYDAMVFTYPSQRSLVDDAGLDTVDLDEKLSPSTSLHAHVVQQLYKTAIKKQLYSERQWDLLDNNFFRKQERQLLGSYSVQHLKQYGDIIDSSVKFCEIAGHPMAAEFENHSYKKLKSNDLKGKDSCKQFLLRQHECGFDLGREDTIQYT
jgi:hypothetical protein